MAEKLGPFELGRVKRCCICGQDKSIAEFWPRGGKRAGFRAECKTCCIMRVRDYRNRPDAKARMSAHRKSLRAENPERYRATSRAWRAKNPDKMRVYYARYRERKRAYRFAKQYGITKERYTAMLTSQLGGCAICGDTNNHGRPLSVDHCHKTGTVRALLCIGCNTILGLSKDDPARLFAVINYLEKHGGI